MKINSIPSILYPLSFILLSACSAAPEKDYDASAACLDQGLHPGTAEYDKCVDSEKANHALDQQRQEFEQQQQQRQIWQNERVTY